MKSGTAGKELHAKGKLALENVNLEAFCLKARKEIFELLGLVSLVSKRFQ
jgi:hypothetical protein